MNYWTTLNFQLNNNGLELATHWVEIAVPARTIYLLVAIWAGYKTYKKIQQKRESV
jgi:hypothetical protein